jgi:hypothetical protein
MFKAGARALAFFFYFSQKSQRAQKGFRLTAKNQVTQKARKAQKWRPSALRCFAAFRAHR